MNWSRHRKQLRSFLAPELRKRINFHVTHYRPTTHVGEAWITVDGERVLSAGLFKWFNAVMKERDRIAETSVAPRRMATETHLATDFPKSEQHVLDRGIYETGFFVESSKEYLDTPLNRALESTNPLIKAMAMADRRLGRRRFAALKVQESDPDIVKLFYALRAASLRASKSRGGSSQRQTEDL